MVQSLISHLARPLLSLISQRFNQLHPEFGATLGRYAEASYLIVLSDQPLNLKITFPAQLLTLELVANNCTCTSSIRGTSANFAALGRKKVDSDALFFQQQLCITGDIEAATALRNALERLDFNLVKFLLPYKFSRFSQLLPSEKPRSSQSEILRSPRSANLPELICPAGNPLMLQSALDAGADAVYFGFNKHGNARNFAGLNFNEAEARCAVQEVHRAKRKIFAAVNAYPQASNASYVKDTIKQAAELEVDALILADIGMLEFASQHYPQTHRHLSVQASASSAAALEFYATEFGIKRAVLPRVLDFAQISDISNAARELSVEIEVFGFGGLCVMAEGRCSLSGYVTGKSPNLHGVCSPADKINYSTNEAGLTLGLDRFQINHFTPQESACYPTLCKGQFSCNQQERHSFEQPTSLSLLTSLHELRACNIAAIKIEGRQRSNAYVRQVVAAFRYALDHIDQLSSAGLAHLNQQLTPLMEGNHATEGAYREQWN